MTFSICFEGVNGVGKDTIINKIYNDFKDKYPTLIVSEPCNINNNLLIRNVVRRNYTLDEIKYYKMTGRINEEINNDIDPFTKLYLFMASRAYNFKKICDFSENNPNGLILLNRQTLSTLTYNVLDTGLSLDDVWVIEREARNDYIPNQIFYLYADNQEIYNRQLGRELEYLNNNYVSKDVNNFINIYKDLNKDKIQEIDNLSTAYIKAIMYYNNKYYNYHNHKQRITEIENIDLEDSYNIIYKYIYNNI